MLHVCKEDIMTDSNPWVTLTNIETHAQSIAKQAHTARAVRALNVPRSNEWVVVIGSTLISLLENCDDNDMLRKEIDAWIERRKEGDE